MSAPHLRRCAPRRRPAAPFVYPAEPEWGKRCSGVVTSLCEGGDEVLTFFRFPKSPLVLLFSLVASGRIKLRRIDGWRKIAVVLSQHAAVAA